MVVASGASYVVFGKEDGGISVKLRDIDNNRNNDGFIINGANGLDYSGFSVSGAGDVNNDGLDDVIIGAPAADPNDRSSGASYVVFGKRDGGIVELADIERGDLALGFVINGANGAVDRGIGDYSGFSVSGAGDVNNDGLDDVIIGAPDADPNGRNSGSGASYVVFGKADSISVELSDIDDGDTNDGFVINGANANKSRSGFSVSGAGDVNGDGLDDLIIRARYESYVVFGKADGNPIELADIKADNIGFVVLTGGTDLESVSEAGDVNDDGYDDLIVKSFTVIYMGSVNHDGYDDLIVKGSDIGSYVIFGEEDIGNRVVGTYAVELRSIDNDDHHGGFVINGANRGDQSGRSVSGTGDVNGDGLDDVIIGANGASYVVFGKADGISVELSDIEDGNTNDGFVINGGGGSVSGAGDVNNDGLDDLIIGVPSADPNGRNSGASYVVVVFGKRDGISIELSDIYDGNTNDGFFINGSSSVSGVGDVNGDRLDDLITGASGARYVVFGKTDGSSVELSDIGDDDGFAINGANDAGPVSGAGDVNGDGLNDVIIGVPGADPNGKYSGASYVVFGKRDGNSVELADIDDGDTNDGFVINGANRLDRSGRSVSGAGDVNGDGLDDVIVGTPSAGPNGSWSGASYVVFGKHDGISVELSDIEDGNTNDGFVINGANRLDRSGSSVSGAGDVNGDGLDDIIIGAHLADPNGDRSGASYVVFGKEDGNPIELADIERADISLGFVINGVNAGDYSGWSVSGAGDVNNDGFDDLLVGAPEADPNGRGSSGASYVIFGGHNVASRVNQVDILLGEDRSATVIINDSADNSVPSGSVTIAGLARRQEPLNVATNRLNDADGLGDFHYQWQSSADGVVWRDIGGANMVSLKLGAAEVGHNIRVIVSWTDGLGNQEQVISPASDVVREPVIDSPVQQAGWSLSTLLLRFSESASQGDIVAQLRIVDATGSELADEGFRYAVSDQRFTVENDLLIVAEGAQFDYESEPFVALRVTVLERASGSDVSETLNLALIDVFEAEQAAQISEFRILGADGTFNEGGGSANFFVQRTGNLDGEVSVHWEILPTGLKPISAEDFVGAVLPSGVIDFVPFLTQTTVALSLLDDSIEESPESFSIRLSLRAGGGRLSKESRSVDLLVLDNDQREPIFDVVNRGSDVNNVISLGSDLEANADGAGGNDHYVVTAWQTGTVVVNDSLGSNIVSFDRGVGIDRIQDDTSNNKLIIMLSSGARLEVLDADRNYVFRLDGDSLSSEQLIDKIEEQRGQPYFVKDLVDVISGYESEKDQSATYHAVGSSGENVFVFGHSTKGDGSGGGGNDTYVVNRWQQGDLEIVDSFGTNTLRFDYGVTIVSVQTVELTGSLYFELANGVEVSVLGGLSDTWRWQLGDGVTVDSEAFIAFIGDTELSVTDNSVSDILGGDADADHLIGGNESDWLRGHGGDDVLDGGDGDDVLEGGDGSDVFVFGDLGNDAILDFETLDRIDLSAIDADITIEGDQEFTYINGVAFSDQAGELRYDSTNANPMLQGDVDGDGLADMEITLYDPTAFSADVLIL